MKRDTAIIMSNKVRYLLDTVLHCISSLKYHCVLICGLGSNLEEPVIESLEFVSAASRTSFCNPEVKVLTAVAHFGLLLALSLMLYFRSGFTIGCRH